MSEWVLTILFFLAVGLTAAKLDEDFADRGLWGFAVLMLFTVMFAAAVGLPYL